MDRKYLLSEKDIPKQWYNLLADFPEPLPPPLHPGTKQPVSLEMMTAIFPENLVLPNGDRFMLNASLVDTSRGHGTDVNPEGQFNGAGHDGKDLTEVGMGTGGGMLIGGLAGGGKGFLIGGTVGATVTVTHWLGKHRSATLPAGTELVMELSRPMTMTTTGASTGQ